MRIDVAFCKRRHHAIRAKLARVQREWNILERTVKIASSTRWAIALYVTGFGSLAAITLLEHSAPIRALFEKPITAAAYLLLQGVLFLAALACSALSLLRGSRRDRLMVAIPSALALLYFALLLWGPG